MWYNSKKVEIFCAFLQMRFKLVKLSVLLLTVIISAQVMVSFSYANESKDYHIESCWWEESANGSLMARWDKTKDTTKYKVHLYKGSTMIFIGAWHSCIATGYNFTNDIASKGTGTYYFRVYPEKLGEDYAIISEPLEVDYEMIKKAKTMKSGTSASTGSTGKNSVDKAIAFLGPNGSVNETGQDRWIQTKDKNWVRQKADGTLYKNQWIEVDGNRYLMDINGIMQKNGWRSEGKYWYYLGSDGAVLKNTTTPDGMAVDSEGRCIIDGILYESYLGPYLISKTTGDPLKASQVPITLITIKAKEYSAGDGKPYNIQIECSRGMEIINTSFSADYDSWKIGRSVTVTVQVAPVAGYYFKKNPKVSPSSNITLRSAQGDEQLYTLKFSYLPKTVLSIPEGFYLTDDGILHWDKVENATKYNLRIRGENNSSNRIETRKAECDVSEYLESEVSVEITASGNTNSKYIIASKAFKIDNLDVFAEDHTIDGTLTKTGNKLRYKDPDGEKFTGWKELMGSWYHFTKGYADGPGWYQDKKTGYWYFFDEEHRLMTGTVTDHGKEYRLNDSPGNGVPLGAWIE